MYRNFLRVNFFASEVQSHIDVLEIFILTSSVREALGTLVVYIDRSSLLRIAHVF